MNEAMVGEVYKTNMTQFYKSNGKRRNIIGYRDQYTPPTSKYTGGDNPILPQNGVKDGICIYSGGQTGHWHFTLTPEQTWISCQR